MPLSPSDREDRTPHRGVRVERNEHDGASVKIPDQLPGVPALPIAESPLVMALVEGVRSTFKSELDAALGSMATKTELSDMKAELQAEMSGMKAELKAELSVMMGEGSPDSDGKLAARVTALEAGQHSQQCLALSIAKTATRNVSMITNWGDEDEKAMVARVERFVASSPQKDKQHQLSVIMPKHKQHKLPAMFAKAQEKPQEKRRPYKAVRVCWHESGDAVGFAKFFRGQALKAANGEALYIAQDLPREVRNQQRPLVVLMRELRTAMPDQNFQNDFSRLTLTQGKGDDRRTVAVLCAGILYPQTSDEAVLAAIDKVNPAAPAAVDVEM